MLIQVSKCIIFCTFAVQNYLRLYLNLLGSI